MKKLIILALTIVLFQPNKTTAQITLDTILHGESQGYIFKTVQISKTETKYYFADTAANTFSLYNMDFTPFLMNVSVPVPFGYTTFQALYISRTLFDCDSSNIEYMYEAPTTPYQKVWIMRTDGTQLFQTDSAYAQFAAGGVMSLSDMVVPIRNTSDGAKMFLLKYNGAYTFSTYIYSLCGTLPTALFDLTNSNQSFVRVFPNPSSSQLNLEVNVPDNFNKYEIVIYNGNSQEIKREPITTPNQRITLDVGNFNSGTYFYSLETKNKKSQAGKFVITK